MAKEDKIDALISTVRELNHQVRPMLSSDIGGGTGSLSEVHTIIGEMRDRELVSSHGVKRMILTNRVGRAGIDASEIQNMMGTGDVRITLEEALAIHDDASTLPTRVVMSEFASAREAILSLLRELPDEEWEAKSNLASDEDRDSVDAVIDYLIAEDRQATGKINQLLAIKA